MIIEITETNINELDNSFLSKEKISQELKNNPFAKILILKEKDKVIGYIYYSEIYERVEINNIEIDSFHRNCGKGDFLLKKMIEAVGKKVISLEVREDNYNAIALYEKNGFIKKAIRKNYYQDKDGFLMVREKDIK